MGGLFRVFRLSAIGVFFAGIISVVQGCSLKEGSLLAALLFLLNFCSLPDAETVSTPTCPPVCQLLLGNSSVTINAIANFPAGRLIADTTNPAASIGTVKQFTFEVDSINGGVVDLVILRSVGGNDYQILGVEAFSITAVLCPVNVCTVDTSGISVQSGDLVGIFRRNGGPVLPMPVGNAPIGSQLSDNFVDADIFVGNTITIGFTFSNFIPVAALGE